MNSLASVLSYIQILLSVLLIAGILLQRPEESLGSAFGGEGMGGARYTRRGFEKIIFNATLLIAILFALGAFVALII